MSPGPGGFRDHGTPPGRHYLDHASTSPLRPEVAREMTAWIEGQAFGDPGRVHFEGRLAREAIERAREAVASLCGTTANRVVFTSGATEAANAAIFAARSTRPAMTVICADVEHSCVREASGRSGAVEVLKAGRTGQVDLDHLADLLAGDRGRRVGLVNCQWATTRSEPCSR